MTKKVLGVRIDDVSKEEAVRIVKNWLIKKKDAIASLQHDDGGKLIFTPGPEFLVTANYDPEFKKVLNSSDLNIPDGFGLKIFAGVKNVIHGVDFMLALCQLAAENNWTIGLLGGQTKVAEKTAEVLKNKFPKLKIAFTFDGGKADEIIKNPDLLRYSDILFVALGHPRQEEWLHVIASEAKQSSFCVGMGVGGGFDFISGIVSEPGEIYSRLGLKWFGRLISRPKYMLPKVVKAVILYPWLSLYQMLKRTAG